MGTLVEKLGRKGQDRRGRQRTCLSYLKTKWCLCIECRRHDVRQCRLFLQPLLQPPQTCPKRRSIRFPKPLRFVQTVNAVRKIYASTVDIYRPQQCSAWLCQSVCPSVGKLPQSPCRDRGGLSAKNHMQRSELPSHKRLGRQNQRRLWWQLGRRNRQRHEAFYILGGVSCFMGGNQSEPDGVFCGTIGRVTSGECWHGMRARWEEHPHKRIGWWGLA